MTEPDPAMLEHSRRLTAHYDADAIAYAALWAPVLLPLSRKLLDRLPMATAGHVIDIGTGAGTLLPELAGAAPNAFVVGVDRSLGMLRIGRTAGRALALVDALRLPMRPASFDVAVMAFVLFHLPDPALA